MDAIYYRQLGIMLLNTDRRKRLFLARKKKNVRYDLRRTLDDDEHVE